VKGAAYVILISILGIAAALSVLTAENEDAILLFCVVLGVIALASAASLIAGGERKIEFDADRFTLKVPGGRYTVAYADVLAVDMRSDLPRGTASASYKAGMAVGGDSGASMQYAPIGSKIEQKVVVRHRHGTMVFSLGNEDETMIAFMTLKSKAAKNLRDARARRQGQPQAVKPKPVVRNKNMPAAGLLQTQMQATANNQNGSASPPRNGNEPPKDFWSALFDSAYRWP
jgi:hypothetical protein